MTTPAVAVPGRMAWLVPGLRPTESYSWSIVHHEFLPAFAGLVPYAVGLVALAEHPLVRVAARIVAEPGRLRAGLALTVGFAPLQFAGVDGTMLAPFFAPA